MYVELSERLEARLQDNVFVRLVFEPQVIETLRSGDSLVDFEGQHLLDQVFRVGRHLGELGDAECVDARLDFLHNFLVALRVEWRDA